jgi:VWFA-related protein
VKALKAASLLACFAWASLAAAGGQTPQFRSRVAAVRVDALVTDGRRAVANLTAANFELRDNGVVQTITDLHDETLPLNVIAALDVSGSIAGEPFQQLKRAYRSVIDALVGQDRAALLTFSQYVDLHSSFTGDRDKLRWLVDEVKTGGATSLHDAVFSALALRETDEGRALMLLLTDGRDTSSWLPVRKLVDAVRRTDIVIYPVTLRRPASVVNLTAQQHSRGRRQDSSERLLEALADDSGGRIVYASDGSALESTFLSVLQEFRQRYVLSYTPTGVSTTGWHAIEVKLRGRRGDVRARRGYFAQ